MPVIRQLTMSECEGFDPEVAECFAPIEPTQFHDAVPKHVIIKPQPVARRLTMSECEGFDSEVAECFARTEPTEFHDMVPKHVTIKPRPIRPQPPFEWDCSEEINQQMKELDLQLHLTAALTEMDILRADLRDARLCSKRRKEENHHLKRQARQLLDEKVSLREQVDRLLNEVDMLRSKRLCVYSGAGEDVGLAQKLGVSQTSCCDHIVSHEQDNKSTRHHELSQSNLSLNKPLSTSTSSSIKNCHQKPIVKKSGSFFRRLTNLFRRNKC